MSHAPSYAGKGNGNRPVKVKPRNEVVTSLHPERAGKYQVMSDGRTVWVNGPDGSSVARVSALLGGKRIGIDIHRPFSEQHATGEQCLDCRGDLVGSAAWDHFVKGVLDFYGVFVDEKHRPGWAS